MSWHLHDIVAKAAAHYGAERRTYQGSDGTVLETRKPNALEMADFTLTAWRQALVVAGPDPDTRDYEEGAWISGVLAGPGDDDLFVRWLKICDVATGSEVAADFMEVMRAGAQ
jgi:hypothetical protein